MVKILISVCGGGLGHASRMVALAKYLQENGYDIVFASYGKAIDFIKSHGFNKIYLSGMWAKVLKCALAIPQTHVRHGALEVKQAAELLFELGLDRQTADALAAANTAREIYQRLKAAGRDDMIEAVCRRAQEYAMKRSGLPVEVFLVTSEDGVVAHV